MKIASFDSGIGGLSVLHHAMKILPNEEFIFFADEDNVPYGTKPRELVMKYVDNAFKFLLTLDVNAIVVACNTATSVAVREMRKRYDLPIIGMEPAIKKALDLYGDKRVLVTATPITINGEKIHSLIDRLGKREIIDLLALPKLVDFAERQIFNSNEVTHYLKDNFASYNFDEYSSLVLGCTHFNYFKDAMRELLPDNVKFIDGNEGTLKELMRRLGLSPEIGLNQNEKPAVEYYFSGRKVTDANELKIIDMYLNRLDSMFAL